MSTSRPLWRRLSGLSGLAVWMALALALRLWVIEPRWIPSGSMLPSLQLQDRILIEKIRPRLGLPLAPGTVVVFRPPPALVAAGYDPKAALIKRVVAGPGDQVAVHQGQLLRNGVAVDPDWTPVAMDYELDPLQLGEDQLLVLGDNRNASLDSHLWGPLPRQQVIGTALLRYWPLPRFGPIRTSPNASPSGSAEQLG
ncbi:MAG: signal peptidase I [Cyanobacteriota bacterium]|nr:signal peptidase I [Cyanobacteriota bacterium]